MVASAIKATPRADRKISYRWLQFWGDLRQGAHPSWLESLPDFSSDQGRPLAHHHHASAAVIRRDSGVATTLDDGLSPDQAKWALLDTREFSIWCEAVGLLSLGEHLKRVLSVRAAERLQINLERRDLATIMQFANTHCVGHTGPLPLHIPTARSLGERAIAFACVSEAPRLWSRLKLRMDKTLSPAPAANVTPLAYTPSLLDLFELDQAMFERTPRHHAAPSPEEGLDKWTQTQTLSA